MDEKTFASVVTEAKRVLALYDAWMDYDGNDEIEDEDRRYAALNAAQELAQRIVQEGLEDV